MAQWIDNKAVDDALIKALGEAVEREMVLPFVVCYLSPNGGLYAYRLIAKDVAPEILATYSENAFAVPATIVVVDQKNASVLVTIDVKGGVTFQ